MLTVVGWIVLGPPSAALVTLLAGRLLGARRSLLALLTAGLIGFTGGVVAAGALTGWDWSGADMVLLTLALGTLFTMAIALAMDMVAPVGSLARGEAAGLITVRNPVRVARLTLRPLQRYRQVIGIARRNGVMSRSASPATLPARVRRTLEDAGGVFVKLGQVASTRSDLLSHEWCEELARLRSAAAPAPQNVMREYVAQLLGDDPQRLFAEFDWSPMASASISQVYRARLHDGSPVVVKVQRPGMDETLARDGAVVMQISTLIERRTALGLSVRPAELAQEFLEGVDEELDFRIEAANAAELEQALAGVEKVRIPRVYPALSGERILTEELISAPNVGQLADDPGIEPHLDRAQLAERVVSLFLRQVFEAGVFHADPHPGNLLVEPDGTIALIDLGAVGHMGQGHREAVLEMLAAASAGDAPALRQALGRITVLDRRADPRELDAQIETMLARHMRAGGITTAAFEDLAVVIGRFGIRLPRWFGSLIRALVTVEGTARQLDPQFSLVEAAKTHARTAVRGLIGDVDPSTALQQELVLQLPRLRRMPERVDELLGQAVNGRLTAQVSLLSDERDVRLITRLLDRLILSVITAATCLASVLLLGVDSGPTLSGGASLNEVLGYFGLAVSTMLAFRIVAGVIRDGET